MPSAVIHICVAKKILKEKKIDEFPFIIGNIAPDSWRNNNEKTRNKSHFSDDDTLKNENYITFYKKYKNRLDNPFVLGYLTHLMTDFYYRQNVNERVITKVNGKNTILKLDGTPYLPADDHRMFFYYNKVYLANSLTNYYKLKKIDLNKIKDIDNPIDEINMDSVYKTASYSNKVEIEDKITPNEVFGLNDSIRDIENCSDFILNELNKLNL